MELKPIPEYGANLTYDEFNLAQQAGILRNSEDGTGYYSTEDGISNIKVYFEEDLNPDFTHIFWIGKDEEEEIPDEEETEEKTDEKYQVFKSEWTKHKLGAPDEKKGYSLHKKKRDFLKFCDKVIEIQQKNCKDLKTPKIYSTPGSLIPIEVDKETYDKVCNTKIGIWVSY